MPEKDKVKYVGPTRQKAKFMLTLTNTIGGILKPGLAESRLHQHA